MGTPDEAKRRAATTYNAAADYFDDPANSFWDRFGRRTVARLDLAPGARVLDVCSGSGASAIPAAEAVGPAGQVLAVDLAEELLALGRAKAEKRGLKQMTCRQGDLLDLGLPEGGFDAVICVFGIFFIPDMPAAVRALWWQVRPGGTLAVTTWGPRIFDPMNAVFWNSVREVRPDLYKGFNPWDRITEPEAVRALLAEGGVSAPEATLENGTHPLRAPEDWWTLVLGSGYRGAVDPMSPDDRERVRRANLNFARENGVAAVEANVIYALARKPAA